MGSIQKRFLSALLPPVALSNFFFYFIFSSPSFNFKATFLGIGGGGLEIPLLLKQNFQKQIWSRGEREYNSPYLKGRIVECAWMWSGWEDGRNWKDV